jgi:hypothetical protein
MSAMDIDAGTDTDTDTATDTENGITDPDAASGSMMVTYTGNANTRNARPHVAMNKTELGFKALRGFILRTFFNKMKQFEAAVECVVLVKGTAYSKKTGTMSQHFISVGNTEYAQAKANEYMSTFLLNEMPDNSDARLVESARLVEPVMWTSESAKVGIASAVDITKILWHEEFDDAKTIDGKKFGRDCKQIWDTACSNPHMMPAWWNATVPGHNIAFTRANVVLHYKVIVETKGQEAFDIEMKRYADAAGGAEDAETTRRIIALREAISALEEVDEPLMNGLVASMKSIVLVQKADRGEILAKALNDASIEMRTFSETLRNESVAEYAKITEIGHRFLAQNAVEHAELDVNDVRSKAIEAQQAFERAKIDAAKANKDLEAAEKAKMAAEELASNVPAAMQCKKHILCANEAGHRGVCYRGEYVNLLLDKLHMADPWCTNLKVPATMMHIRELVTTGGKTMAEAFVDINWRVAADKKEAYDEWYNEPYIVNQFGTTIKTYGEALWAEIVERFIDDIIPLPKVATKTKADLKKDNAAAKKAEKVAAKAVEKAAKEAAKVARQAKMTAREVAAAKRLKSIQDGHNVFKPKLSSRQEMAAEKIKKRRGY